MLASHHNAGLDDILTMDAYSLSIALARNKLTCVDVMHATLNRIDEINDNCRAIILLRDRIELLKDAAMADDRRQQRRNSVKDSDAVYSPFEDEQWLCGIPIAIKDISNVKGIPTTFGGSPLFEGFLPPANDLYVDNLINKGGAICIGKTNTPEIGLGSHTFNKIWGTTPNPFDSSRSAGGSSGGAAVAVSTGMFPCLDGTDMMGSLRNPAGWNNIYSHRPTAGMIPGALKSKMNPLPYPISTAGPMARSPIDLVLLLGTMVGNKKKFNAAEFLGEQNHRSDKGMRIGWLGDWSGHLPFEDGILSLCFDALNVMRDNGLVKLVDDLSSKAVFPADQLWTSWNTVRFGMVADNFLKSFDEEKLLGKDSRIKEEMKWEILQGKDVSSADVEKARLISNEWHECLESLFEKYDVLALPSAQVWPYVRFLAAVMLCQF